MRFSVTTLVQTRNQRGGGDQRKGSKGEGQNKGRIKEKKKTTENNRRKDGWSFMTFLEK